jgi:DNA-binding transcriptional LysR family regulator
MIRCGLTVFDDLRKGVEEVAFLADPTAGEVRVACSEPVSAGVVSAIVNRFVQKYPRISFNIHVRDPLVIYRDLEARDVEFVIAQTTVPIHEDHMEKETLYHEQVVVVAGTQHPLARKRRVELIDLANEPWVLPPPGSFINSLVTETFRANGLPAPRKTVVGTSAYMRLMLLAGGQMLTIVPAVMLKLGAKHWSVKALPIELPANRRPVSLVTLKNRALSPVAQLFIEHARSIAKTMVKG